MRLGVAEKFHFEVDGTQCVAGIIEIRIVLQEFLEPLAGAVTVTAKTVLAGAFKLRNDFCGEYLPEFRNIDDFIHLAGKVEDHRLDNLVLELHVDEVIKYLCTTPDFNALPVLLESIDTNNDVVVARRLLGKRELSSRAGIANSHQAGFVKLQHFVVSVEVRTRRNDSSLHAVLFGSIWAALRVSIHSQ